MAWLSIIGNILLYLLVPPVIVFRWLLIAIGPVVHLFSYTLSLLIIPLRFLGKFEVYLVYFHLVNLRTN